MAELALNHVGQDTVTVSSIPCGLPAQRAMDGKGHYVNDANGQPQYLKPRHALIYVGSQPVRWRADGIAPAPAPGQGMFQAAGTYINWTDPLGDFLPLILNARFVLAEGATGNGVLEISFFT